jgi:hypothetical protein
MDAQDVIDAIENAPLSTTDFRVIFEKLTEKISDHTAHATWCTRHAFDERLGQVCVSSDHEWTSPTGSAVAGIEGRATNCKISMEIFIDDDLPTQMVILSPDQWRVILTILRTGPVEAATTLDRLLVLVDQAEEAAR